MENLDLMSQNIKAFPNEEVIDLGSKACSSLRLQNLMFIILIRSFLPQATRWNKSGTLLEGIECWENARSKFQLKEHIKERVRKASVKCRHRKRNSVCSQYVDAQIRLDCNGT